VKKKIGKAKTISKRERDREREREREREGEVFSV